jgi:hypothetical protein
MKSFKIIAFTALIGVAISGCNKKYEDYAINTNKPSNALEPV